MKKEYAIGIDLGGTSVKYALIDNNGVFHFQGKLPSNADVSAEAVIGQLIKAVNEVKNFAEAKSRYRDRNTGNCRLYKSYRIGRCGEYSRLGKSETGRPDGKRERTSDPTGK